MDKSKPRRNSASVKWQDRVGRSIRLRDLHIVLAVAQTGSMAKAANSLAMSHPVISKTISDLEHVLKKRLFDRSARGVAPTIYGEALAKCAVAVFDEMRRGVQQIEFLADPSVGKLRFACPEAIAAGLVHAAASRFMKKYSKVVLEVLQAETVTARYDELRTREIEFIIGRIPAILDENDLLVEKLFNERLLVVAGASSPWVRRRSVSLGDLIEQPWVLPPNDSVPGILGHELFKHSGLPMPHADMLTLSIHLQHALLSNGRFLTLLPSSLLHFGGSRYGLREVPVRLPPQASFVGIVTARDRTLSPLAGKFIECVRSEARPLTKVG